MKILYSFAFLLLLLSACNRHEPVPDNFDYGSVANNVYHNNYFSMELPIPSSWTVQNKETIDSLNKIGTDLVAGDDTTFKHQLEAASISTATLLSISKYPKDSLVLFNPSIILLAENIKGLATTHTSKDYLQSARELMRKSAVKYEFPVDIYSREIQGNSFSGLKAIAKLNSPILPSITQEYYSIIKKGFAFNIILSYATPEQQEELYGIIQALKMGA